MELPEKPNDKSVQGVELRHFFSKRVTDQIRHMMELWRIVNSENWSVQRLLELKLANEKLIRYARRFKESYHAELASKIDELLNLEDLTQFSIDSQKIEKLSSFLQQLSQTALRKQDSHNETASSVTPKKPIYIILNDHQTAKTLSKQLKFFGYRATTFDHSNNFFDAMKERYPSVLIVDIDFESEFSGFDIVENIQENLDNPIPTLFYSQSIDDVTTRLTAARLGGLNFHYKNLEVGRIVEEIETITNIIPPKPYRVLVVEDSKFQSHQFESMLNTAGVITRAINNPLEVLDAVEEFEPEIILMDMYMPGCNGRELARVIRQQEKYVSLPIVFLSSEDDLEVQLAAMSEGGDDFLTKPIKPAHLRSTIRAKAQRTRALVSLLIRDSLTGLLNHTSILKTLQQEADRNLKSNSSLCFVMLDIDHFKNVNDTYGHPIGDKVIRSLSLFLKQRLRKGDAIGRYGGEEFAVVMPNTNLKDCVVIFEDIRAQFAQFSHSSGSKSFCSSFSCGIALMQESFSIDALKENADEALYQAKRGGRNRVCVYQTPLKDEL